MAQERDTLAEWKQNVSALKFKLGRPTEKVFADALHTEKVLRAFFNKSDYTLTPQGAKEDNYLIYLLANVKPTEIRLLNEMAELIEYAEQKGLTDKLKGKNKLVNHEGLSKILFEIYVDKYLSNCSLATRPDAHYTDSKGQVKPLDNYVEFDGQSYLVECFRFSDSEALSLLRISEKLMRVLTKGKIHIEQMFIGHIGFKTTRNLSQTIDNARNQIEAAFERYLACYESNNPAGVIMPPMQSTEDYDLDINHYYMGPTHEEQWETKKYNTLITFAAKPKLTTINHSSLSITGKRIKSVASVNRKLYEKIRTKRKQHQDFQNNKIYFIEIDMTFSHSPNNPILMPIDSDKIDYEPYKELVKQDPKVIIVFVFKKATDKDIERNIQILYEQKHETLINALRHVI